MRKFIKYDKKLMEVYHYVGAPIHQILMLDLSAEEQVILLNFFGHDEKWTIGSTGITERNFYRKKNQQRVNQTVKKLKDMGYVEENETEFIINIFKIQEDYKKNLTLLTQSKGIKKTNKIKIDSLTTLTQSKGVDLTQSKEETLTQSKGNNINNNRRGVCAKSAELPAINKTNGFDLVVGDVAHQSLTSQPSASFAPSLTPQQRMGLNGNTSSEITPKVRLNNTPTNFGEHSEQANTNPTEMIVEDMPNDLQFLINNSKVFKSSYDYAIEKGRNWSECDISTYTNAKIAYAVVKRLKGTPVEDIPSQNPSNTYNLITTMVKLSKKIDDSKLWQEFLRECNNDSKIISKLETV